VENPIELSVPGVPADRVQASISTGRIARSGSGWVATGMTGNRAEVFATATMADGSARRIGPVVFRVKDLPAPMAYVGQRNALDGRIRKSELTAAQGLAARLPDSEFGAQFQVLRFDLLVERGAQPIERPVNGALFDADVKTIFSRLRSGDRVIFQGIRARLANAPAGTRTYDLAPISWKVAD
jgi:hypothetical protein